MFKNPFSFYGRIRRLEYGISVILFFLSLFVVGLILDSLNSGGDSQIMPLILSTPSIWFLITQRAKRCHDRSVSGAWQLIPFYGWVLLFGDSDPGDNEYGPNPKDVAYTDDWDPFAPRPIAEKEELNLKSQRL